MKPQLRKDYIEEVYVIIAPKRGARPRDYKKSKSDLKIHETCVFCLKEQKNIPGKLTYGGKNWRVKIIGNKYPAFSLDNSDAYGLQEIVIETPQHNCMLHEQSENRIAEILKAYAERTLKITQENKKIQYILIFKNQGAEAGASLRHAHSQIFAMGFLPPHLYDKSKRIHAHRLKYGSCIYCDVIKTEVLSPRHVYSDNHIVVFTPYASQYNYEVWVFPKRHIDNITLMTKKERDAFANILKKLLVKIKALDLSYNFYFHQVVFDNEEHLYMKIRPRGSTWAGLEISSGVVINSISPEDAAEYYRK